MVQPTLDLSAWNLEEALKNNVIDFFSAPWVKHYEILPLKYIASSNKLIIAKTVSTPQEALQAISFHTGAEIIWKIAENDALQRTRCIVFNYLQEQKNKEEISVVNEKLENFSVEKWMQELIGQAIYKKASDIHFERYEMTYRVRFRLDGLLQEVSSLPLEFADRVTAYLKNKAYLDTSERRLPQDGRFKWLEGEIDCRISTSPTINGEKVVIRLLHASELKQNINDLGFNSSQQKLFLNVLKQPQGLILVTGPTGSGKTVTLYSALSYLNTIDKNILTIEEPVEIRLPGLNQVEVNIKAGLTFARAIRTFLRQDPDIIMVGEIRDLETAQMVIHAAQTGHLVLSTLHANGALETIARLAYLGIPLFQIADSVKLIIAQRLVRKSCKYCYGKACERCYQGFKGRIGLFEMLSMNRDLASHISKGVTEIQILEKLNNQLDKMNLYESGCEKINLGLTTPEEVLRVIGRKMV